MSKDKKTKNSLIEQVTVDKTGFFKRVRQTLPRITLLLRLITKRVPSFLPFVVIFAIVRSAQITIAVFIPKFFIDAVSKAMPWDQALQWIIAAALAEGILRLVHNWMLAKSEILQNRIDNEMGLAIAEKIAKLAYSDLENPEILTLKEEASFVLTNQGAGYMLVMRIRDIVQQLLTTATLLTILSQMGFAIIIIILVIVGLIAWLQNTIKSYETAFYMNLVGVNRKYGYFLNTAFSDEQQQPIRLYKLESMITERVETMNLELLQYIADYLDRQAKVQGLQSILTDLQAAVAYGYAGLRVVSSIAGPRITLGSFSLYAGAAIQFTASLRSIFDNLRDIKQNVDMLEPFERFMKLADRETDDSTTTVDPIETITFENVCFTYPGTTEPVLKNVSFTIEKGSKISIVGLNGAGKTTLIKLLCRFFQPDSGRILINNTDIQTLPESAYLAEIAAVFQDFRLLPFSIKSNISSKADESISQQDLRRIRAIAEETSVSSILENLADGLDTNLNKNINEKGTELSGGQAQKLAIARALYKQASLVILDEPTSALDPLAEAEIYEHFDTLVRGQTAIYISHRMSSSRFCDKVLVLDGGTVVDYAPHDELVCNENSLYTQLFNEQKQYYALN